MIARRLLALAVAAAVLLPAAAQAHWVEPCGCQRVHDYFWHHHHHYRLHERTSLAVELTENVFAVPYRLRHYPYVSFDGGMAGGYGPVIGSGMGRDQAREIDADAKVTILGPNRMDIRLYRKGRGTIINPR